MSGETTAGELCVMAVIANERGLHARAAAKFVRVVESHDAEVAVVKDDVRVSGRSIMGLMMLAAARGTQLSICCSGADALTVQAALLDLIKRKFDEE